MGCSGCQKRRAMVKMTSLRGSKASREARPVKRSLSANPRFAQQPEEARPTLARCPVCMMVLRRVARKGQGDLVQCPNPQCNYIRKAK